MDRISTDAYSMSPWNGRAAWWRITTLVLVVLTLGGFQPAVAPGATAARAVTLAFGELYGDSSRRHLGCDVSAAEGESVRSPVAGTITFAGWVPREAGVRVRAVTVQADEGFLVTVSPLGNYSVSRGDAVGQGVELGTVSGGGDPSSPGTHVHLSLREGGAYRDPSHLIGGLFRGEQANAESPRAEQPVPAPSPNAGLSAAKKVARGAATEPQSVTEAQGAVTLPVSTASTVPLSNSSSHSTSPQTAAGVTSPGAVSYPQGSVVPVAPHPVVRAEGLSANGRALTPVWALGAESRTVSVGSTASRAPGPSVWRMNRAVLSWALFGVGSALGAVFAVVSHYVRSDVLAERPDGLFAVRGNRW